jgi:hypothetical protein
MPVFVNSYPQALVYALLSAELTSNRLKLYRSASLRALGSLDR